MVKLYLSNGHRFFLGAYIEINHIGLQVLRTRTLLISCNIKPGSADRSIDISKSCSSLFKKDLKVAKFRLRYTPCHFFKKCPNFNGNFYWPPAIK
jgi:hypothetical protein